MTRDELVKKMLAAFYEADWSEHYQRQMARALTVAAEECTRIVLEQRCKRHTPWDAAVVACADAIKSALTQPKTPEERVTLRPTYGTLTAFDYGWAYVHLDGQQQYYYGPANIAELVRLGLIQKLKDVA